MCFKVFHLYEKLLTFLAHFVRSVEESVLKSHGFHPGLGTLQEPLETRSRFPPETAGFLRVFLGWSGLNQPTGTDFKRQTYVTGIWST